MNILVMRKDAITYFKALGDETRWRILCLVNDEALCVCEIADILDMPQSTISSHVQIIRKAHLLESERRGKWTYFRISSHQLVLFEQLLKHFPNSSFFKNDQKKMKARLINRANSCCPGPIKLI